MYDAADRRFLAVDIIAGNPINPQSLNRYSYVLNRPTIFVDLNGLSESYMLTLTQLNGNKTGTRLFTQRDDGTFLASEALKALGGDISFFLGNAGDEYVTATQLVLMMNTYVPGIWGPAIGHSGYAAGYFFQSTCNIWGLMPERRVF